MNRKGCVRQQSLPNSGYCAGICLVSLRETIKFPSWDSRCPGQEGIQDSSVGLVSRIQARQQSNQVLIPSRLGEDLCTPGVRWVTGAPYPQVKRKGVKLTTYLHVVPSFKSVWICTSSPHIPSWSGPELSTGTSLLGQDLCTT